MKTDIQIAREFFEMLKKEGAKIKETVDDTHGAISFEILDSYWEDYKTLEFSFHANGSYWRIDGAVTGPNHPGYYKEKIHQRGCK